MLKKFMSFSVPKKMLMDAAMHIAKKLKVFLREAYSTMFIYAALSKKPMAN